MKSRQSSDEEYYRFNWSPLVALLSYSQLPRFHRFTCLATLPVLPWTFFIWLTRGEIGSKYGNGGPQGAQVILAIAILTLAISPCHFPWVWNALRKEADPKKFFLALLFLALMCFGPASLVWYLGFVPPVR